MRPAELEAEEAQAKNMEALFHNGKQEVFVEAMKLQLTAKHVDFLGRACALVTVPLEDWFDGSEHDGKYAMHESLDSQCIVILVHTMPYLGGSLSLLSFCQLLGPKLCEMKPWLGSC